MSNPDRIAISTDGYRCGGNPNRIAIATIGYRCAAIVFDRRDGDGGTGIRQARGGVIVETTARDLPINDLALLAVIAIESHYAD